MDDAPRRSLKALVVTTGLLVLVGAGCGKQPSVNSGVTSTSRAPISDIEIDRLLTAKDGNGYPYVVGIRSVCSLENARMLFPKDENWTEITNVIKEKEQQGWILKEFCYDKRIGGGFVMEQASEKTSFLVGSFSDSAGQTISLSKPFVLSEEGAISENWTVRIMPPTDGLSIVWATIYGENRAYTWRETYAFASDGSPENKVEEIERCKEERAFDKPSNLKINLQPCKN